MTDWLYEASNAQANLEVARQQLYEAEESAERYRSVLQLIATDYVELSHDKVREQRDHYRRISRDVLGIDNATESKGDSDGKIDDNF